MAYRVTNVSRTPLHEDLDTKDAHGKRQSLHVGPRQHVELNAKQFASRSVQKHIAWGRLRVEKIS